MNKTAFRLVPLLCLGLLPSCASAGGGKCEVISESADLTALSTALESLQDDLQLKGDCTSIYIEDGDAYSEGNYQILLGQGFASYSKTFSDVYSREEQISYTFSPNAEGKVSYSQLNVHNEMSSGNLYEVKTSRVDAKGEKLPSSFDFAPCLVNSFKGLAVGDFSYVAGRYYLNADKLSRFDGFATFLSVNDLGYYACEVGSLSFALKDGEATSLLIDTVPQSDQSISPADFFFEYSFSLTPMSGAVMPAVTPKTHYAYHDVLKAAMAKASAQIAGENYTVNVSDDTGESYGVAEYQSVALADGFYSTFKPLIYVDYPFFKKQEDGTYHKFYYFSADQKDSTGKLLHAKGDVVAATTSGDLAEYTIKNRSDLELSFDFAPEFFTYNSNKHLFSCSQAEIVGQLGNLLMPWEDRTSEYGGGATRVRIQLDEAEESIVSWSVEADDQYASYSDVFTYSLSDVGTSVIPSVYGDLAK